MSAWKKLLATSAAAGGGLNVEEVFSTYVYDGTNDDGPNPTQTITNGIDLSGEGGLVWTKARDYSANHALVDTVRGNTKYLESDGTGAESTTSVGITAFNSNGYTLGADNTWKFNVDNAYVSEYASWTFRKAPKFFDVVTWTGSGGARTLSHNLGSTPGCIIVKDTSNAGENWWVYHRGIASDAETDAIYLNSSAAAFDESGAWNDTAPTSTQFTVGANLNSSFGGGANYVAYLFAHNNSDGNFGPNADQDIIKCGSYTGNGSSQDINLGFEPQWVLFKNSSYNDIYNISHWSIYDNMRGVIVGGDDTHLRPNTTDAEQTQNDELKFTATGFSPQLGTRTLNASGDNYIYIAIRRGPMAVPTDATDVFAQDLRTADGYVSGFPVDMFIHTTDKNTTHNNYVYDRLTPLQLDTTSTAAEGSTAQTSWFADMEHVAQTGANNQRIAWMWRRAPSFFDVVAYKGTGSATTISHNLGVAPEMIWVKSRSHAVNWGVYHKDLSAGQYLELNKTNAVDTNSAYFTTTAPTSSVFSIGVGEYTNQSSSHTYIAYLFASLDGVSKVGSFTHTSGTTQNIDCGFSSGARFVLVKQYASTGNWFVYDTERGIVSGNDPRLALNTTSAENTSNDDIDPYSAGFTLTTNFSGGSYIFYAIA